MNGVLPSTILHPETFRNSPSIGFDGAVDWYWVNDAFEGSAISPMDIDGVIERHGNFLIIESKGHGVPVPKGQMITLERFYAFGCVTVLFVWGKNVPRHYRIWCATRFIDGLKHEEIYECTGESLTTLVRQWREHAEQTPRTL